MRTPIDFDALPAGHVVKSYNGATLFARVVCEEKTLNIIELNTAHRDARGRVIGGAVVVKTRAISLAPDQSAHMLGTWTGACYTVEPHALRDGARFGALQRVIEYDTKDQVDAYIERYFAGVEKRAAKIAAKGA